MAYPNAYMLKDVLESEERQLFKVVSFFAGGGGSSTGYRLAGGKVLAINEFIPEAQAAYAKNYPATPILPGDIRTITPEMVCEAAGVQIGELDILDGSPPCASFSMSGNREKDWGKVKKYSSSKQRTDDLFYEYARMVRGLQPKVFVAENVKGLTIGVAKEKLGREEAMFQVNNAEPTFTAVLRDCGYNVNWKVLNSADFGVPQARERLIIIGVRKDLGIVPSFPARYPGNRFTLRQAIEDVAPVGEELAFLSKLMRSIDSALAMTPMGQSHPKHFNIIRTHPDKPCSTMTAATANGSGIHHWDCRRFSIAECRRIMSFPDDYYLGEKYKHALERLGRAVPPLLMKAVAAHIHETILNPLKQKEAAQ